MRRYIRAEIDSTAWLAGIVLLADLVPGEHTIGAVSKDPDDDKYIAAAIEGRAAWVVTGDLICWTSASTKASGLSRHVSS